MQAFSSLVALLDHRAATQPDDDAYVLLSDRGAREAGLTFAQLHSRAGALARELLRRGVPGDRALLIFPQGLDFIVALFGCLMAGVIAVPMMVPRRQSSRDSSASITANCAPRFILTSPALMSGPRKDIAARFADGAFEWMVVDATGRACAGRRSSAVDRSAGTSRSCNTPRARPPTRRASWSRTTICCRTSR